LTPYGDSAFLIEVADVGTAHRVARAIAHASRTGRAPDGIEDLVTGFASVVVRIDPDGDRLEQWEQWLADLVSRDGRGASAFGSDAPEGSGGDPEGVARTIDVPTTFDGPDLEVVASGIGCSPAGVVELLTQAELRVAFVGFVPGFPYLTGLPPELVAVARRSTPRPSVPAGSVAVAGGFASIYPRAGAARGRRAVLRDRRLQPARPDPPAPGPAAPTAGCRWPTVRRGPRPRLLEPGGGRWAPVGGSHGHSPQRSL
jgi:KipI family sensor histidine kinase inhibitor